MEDQAVEIVEIAGRMSMGSHEISNLEINELEDLFASVPVHHTSFEWSDCNKTCLADCTFYKHHILTHCASDVHIDSNDANDENSETAQVLPIDVDHASNTLIDDFNKKQRYKKKSKLKKSTPTKLVKTLQEDESEMIKLFSEKIDSNGSFYFCKSCDKFSTVSKMKAKSHAVFCGKVKKAGRPAIHCKCLECDATFLSRKELLLHSRTHLRPQYSCSKCLKTFNWKPSYIRHLRSHEEPPQLKCEDCGKTFRYKSNLKRHKAIHTKAPIEVVKPANESHDPSIAPVEVVTPAIAIENYDTTDSRIEVVKPATESNDTIDYEIDLEERRSGGDHFGKLSYTVVTDQHLKYQKNRTTFESSLGLNNMEQWELYVDVSNILGIPLSDSGAVEHCSFTNRQGKTTVKFAWNTFLSPVEMVSKLVYEIVDDAINTPSEVIDKILLEIIGNAVSDASIKDPNISNDEVGEIVDSMLKDLMAKYAPLGILDDFFAPIDVRVDEPQLESEHGSGGSVGIAGVNGDKDVDAADGDNSVDGAGGTGGDTTGYNKEEMNDMETSGDNNEEVEVVRSTMENKGRWL